MNKTQLANLIARQNRLTQKEAVDMLDSVLYSIKDGLTTEGKISLQNFGTFSVVTRKARMGTNPQNPSEKIHIPEKKSVKFSPSKAIKEKVN